jgi:L-asparaginase II
VAHPVPLARVVRSGVEESVHLGSVVVCDADGRIVLAAGDPERFLFTRSCTKPLQASVSLGAIEGDLPQDLLALACGSHNGEPEHVRGVRRMLRRGGLAARDLGCPPDRPSRGADAAEVSRPSPVFHNCSGKHAAMLLACVGAGWDTAAYLAPSHPLQRAIARAVAAACDAEPTIGVDGCGAPVHGVPLRGLATMYARLATPARLGALASRAARATDAMRAHPFLVAGTGRSDTALMTAFPGIVTKVGAEGAHCAAIPALGLGVAVKVEDGADRAAAPTLLRTLAALGVADEDALPAVARRPVLGGGRQVGEVEAVVRLRRPR